MGLKNLHISKENFYFNGSNINVHSYTTRESPQQLIETTEEYIEHLYELPEGYDVYELKRWIEIFFDLEQIEREFDIEIHKGGYQKNACEEYCKITITKDPFERNQLF